MEGLNSFNFSKYKDRASIRKRNKAPHSKAALVDEIIKVVGENKFYSYGFWLRQLKKFEERKGTPAEMLAWLKTIQEYPANFNKGAILTNKLKKYGVERKTDEIHRDNNSSVSSKEKR